MRISRSVMAVPAILATLFEIDPRGPHDIIELPCD